MRIFFTSIQDLSRDVNGVACHARDLREHLGSRGHRVAFITPYDFPTRSSRAFALGRRVLYRIHGRTGLSCAYYLVLSLLRSDIRARLERSEGRMDIINAQDVITAGAAIEAARGKIPVLLTCHFWTDPTREFVDAGFIRPDSWSARRLGSRVLATLRHPDLRLVAVSRRNQRLLAELAGEEVLGRTRVVHLGVDPPARLPDIAGGKDSEPVVINVGKIDRRKNQRLLVEVAKAFSDQHRPCRFLLLGPEDAGERVRLEARIRESGLEDRVLFTGRQDRIAVFEAMRKASLYFHASREESFGMTLIEAMSVGLPVFALRYDAVDEILPATPEAVVEPEETPAAIAKKLMRYLDDPERLERLAREQGAVYRQRFSLGQMTDGFEEFYEDLVAKKI